MTTYRQWITATGREFVAADAHGWAATPWPSSWSYAITHRCSRCKAPPGQVCDAPGKLARATQQAEWGHRVDPAHLLHSSRQDAGIRRYRRDVGRAPWPEDREPGQRYDTVPDEFYVTDELYVPPEWSPDPATPHPPIEEK